jgi:hypothetical protein
MVLDIPKFKMVGITMKFFIGHTSTQLWGEENQ